MSLTRLAPGETFAGKRGEPVVCVPVFNARELFEDCLRSVVANTPEGTRVLVADDASTDREIEAFTEQLAGDASGRLKLAYLRQPENLGFVGNMNAVFRATAPADVVIVNSDVVLPERWLERLRAAAYSDELVATAGTLSNSGTILSVPTRNLPSPELPQGLSLAEVDERVARASGRLCPRIPTGIGHCLYVRRSALELVGLFDEAFSPGYGEEVDFSQRCVAHGLWHVVADDLYVFHRGAGSFGEAHGALQLENELELNRRYPHYAKAVYDAANSEELPLSRALAAARLSIAPLTVTVDGTCLGSTLTGTQVLALELAGALARAEDVQVRVMVLRSLGERPRAILDALRVDLLWQDEIDWQTKRTDIVHRPFQLITSGDLALLGRLGRRVVITQQDSIAYHNPTYFKDQQEWRAYREFTRQGLGLADQVVFSSPHALEDALSEDLVDEQRAQLVPLGTDHRVVAPATDPTPPGSPADIAAVPFLLCLGTDFLHKNRLFAIRLLAALRAGHGFAGRLVFAGAHADYGTSAAEENAFLSEHEQLAPHVVDLGACSDAEKAWLYGHAALVVYPTLYEGFGFVPFEAAEAGTPALWAAQSSLADLLPRDLAEIVPWDVQATAVGAARLIHDADARQAHVAGVREAAAKYTWDRTAERLVGIYRETAVAPARAGPGAREAPSELALSLVGPSGYLTPEDQRALLAVSARPALKRTVFSALRAGYRTIYRANRARGNAEAGASAAGKPSRPRRT